MIRNAFTARLEKAGTLSMWTNALSAAWRMKQLTGASTGDMIKSARGMMGHGSDSFAQALMGATAPVFIQRATVEGKPDEGVMATGQVAGRLTDLPSCEELISRIVVEAEAALDALIKRLETN